MDLYIKFVIVLCASSFDFGKCDIHDLSLQQPGQDKTHFRNVRFLVDQNSIQWMSEQQRVSCATTCIEAYKSKTQDCCHTGSNMICFDVPLDILKTYIGQCDVDGQRADWGAWGSCSQTCSNGTATRSRTCSNPVPSYGGKQCVGNFTDVQNCFDRFCPIDGQWADWSAWGSCSQTCSNGTATRYRTCSNPLPQYAGKQCVGNFTDVKDCFDRFCPIVRQSTTSPAITSTSPDSIMVAFCRNKNSIQCGTTLRPVCGSNTRFYLNQCEYSKAHCDNTNLTTMNSSFCRGNVASHVTISPTMTGTAPAFCLIKNTIHCANILQPICGSDKKFYLNQCVFVKAYCDDMSLTEKDDSFCY